MGVYYTTYYLVVVNPLMVFIGAGGAQGDFAGATLVASLRAYTFGTHGVVTVPASALLVSALAFARCVEFAPLQLSSMALEGHAGRTVLTVGSTVGLGQLLCTLAWLKPAMFGGGVKFGVEVIDKRRAHSSDERGEVVFVLHAWAFELPAIFVQDKGIYHGSIHTPKKQTLPPLFADAGGRVDRPQKVVEVGSPH